MFSEVGGILPCLVPLLRQLLLMLRQYGLLFPFLRTRNLKFLRLLVGDWELWPLVEVWAVTDLLGESSSSSEVKISSFLF